MIDESIKYSDLGQIHQMSRKLLFAFALIAFIVFILYDHRSVTDEEIHGQYADAGNATVVNLHSDGTFTNYSRREIKTGHWQLQTWTFAADDLILTSDENGPKSYADEYLLTRKLGSICIEADGDDGDAYWCKSR